MPALMRAARALTIAFVLSLGGCRCGDAKFGKNAAPAAGQEGPGFAEDRGAGALSSVNGLPLGITAPPPEKPVVGGELRQRGEGRDLHQPPTDPETLAAPAKVASRPTAEYDDAELPTPKLCELPR
jgi:hypothetical protein